MRLRSTHRRATQRRFTRRHTTRTHPTRRRSVLTVVGIALGAALLAAVLTLSVTMQEAVLQQVQREMGDWDIGISVPNYGVDNDAHLSQDTIAFIRSLPGVAYVVPQATFMSGSIETPVQYYVSIGTFPASPEGSLMSHMDALQPGEVLLPERLARQLGVSVGDTLSLPFARRERSVHIAGLLSEVQTGSMPSAYFSYEWLADALELVGPPSVLVGLQPGVSKTEVVAEIQFKHADLLFDVRKSIDEMRWRLEGLSGVAQIVGVSALLAGAILALTAFGISVQERTRELTLLRAIGATPGQVGRMLVREALTLGGSGGAVGVAVGLAVAAGIARVVGRHLDIPFATLTIPWVGLAFVFIGTVVLTLLGAWPAARRAGRTTPLAAMRPVTSSIEYGSQRRTLVATIACCVTATVAVGLALKLPGPANSPLPFFLRLLGAAFLLFTAVVSLSLTVPDGGRWGAVLMEHMTSSVAFLGMRNVQRQKVRSGRTAGILVVGIALLVAVVSFLATERDDTERNIAQRFPAQGWISGPWAPPSGYGDDFVAAVAAIDGVTKVVPAGREVEADLLDYDVDRIDTEYRRIVERRGEPAGRLTIQTVDFELLQTVADFGRVEGDLYGGIVLTRHIARRFGIALGDELTIRPLNGSPIDTVAVTALVDELPQIHNLVADKRFFPDLYRPGEEYKVSFIDFDETADRDRIADDVRSLLAAGYAAFSYSDFDEWKARWRQQFFETMAMVAGMAVLLLFISAAGLLNTMAANLHERREEMATLYAIGATPAQIGRIVRAEALAIGTVGSILGVATGVLMVYALLGGAIPQGLVLSIPLSALVGGLLAGPAVAVAAAAIVTRNALVAG